MSRMINACVQFFLRLFMPGVASDLRAENQFALHDASGAEPLDSSLYLDVEDNGADTTIIAFAGMAVLYAAMPKFEFKKMLQEGGEPYNFVFVRDIYRSSYRFAPDNSGEGIAFYARVVSEALRRIGARQTIAIGMSGGAEAAFRISGAAPIDRIIAFNPAFPFERYSSWRNIFHAMADVRKLALDPGAYLELFFVALGTRYLWKRNQRTLGYEDPDQPLNDYLRRAVPVTLFYSRGARSDVYQALTLKDIPSITLTPMESSRHNCLAEMKKQGIAGSFIRAAIQQQESELSAREK